MNLSNNVMKGMATSANQSIRNSNNTTPNNNGNGSMVNNNNNQNVDRTNTNTMNMEAKLHHVAGSFRQKRDDAYRQQQLAYERRKLVNEEVIAATQTVSDLHTKLNHLQNEAGCNPVAQEKLNHLRSTVTKLVREVQVQHEEVVMKRNKVQEIRDKMTHTSKKHETIRTNLQQAIQSRRFHLTQLKEEYDQMLLEGGYNNDMSLSNTNAVPSTNQDQVDTMQIELLENNDNPNDNDDPITSVKKELLLNEIKSDHDGKLWKKWSQLIEDKANSLYNANEKLREEMITLQCVLTGYEKLFNNNNSEQQELNSNMIVVDDMDQSNQNEVEPVKVVDETELTGNMNLTMEVGDPLNTDDDGVANTIQNTSTTNGNNP